MMILLSDIKGNRFAVHEKDILQISVDGETSVIHFHRSHKEFTIRTHTSIDILVFLISGGSDK